MAAEQIVKAHIEGLTDQGGGSEIWGTLSYKDSAGNTVTGMISPNLQTLRAVHNADVKPIKGQNGRTSALMANDETIECSFDFIAEGSTRAEARGSAMMPPMLGKVAIANMPVIVCGSFSDALNSTGGSNTYPWIYMGGGQIMGQAEDAWTGSITLKRFRGIPTHSFIS